MNVRGRLRSAVTENRVARFLRSDGFRVFSVLGVVGLFLALSIGGVLSGAGLFILMMIQMDTVGVVGASLLFSFSVAVGVACYLWLTR